ncbi:MAG TPA: DUF4244 domain-containing protein [Ornithinimicrobium sp.]|uniref:DUF4244 domain-containing protein n=1 Tax=Ornithinimicrobium sp. TaxID=1977084 RepID=UPI002B47D048|nr:DUF4244 domain-containing protein [Ornithinimicrobium sp.]HKJ12372.1 DUF4244 domain-containing protein [Ornithinimicrobium sp.]
MKIRYLLRRARHALRGAPKDAGMTTAEYAVGTLAACALAAVLLTVVSSDSVRDLIARVITTALSGSL